MATPQASQVVTMCGMASNTGAAQSGQSASQRKSVGLSRTRRTGEVTEHPSAGEGGRLLQAASILWTAARLSGVPLRLMWPSTSSSSTMVRRVRPSARMVRAAARVACSAASSSR